MSKTNAVYVAWLSAVVVTAVSVIAWMQARSWQFENMTAYKLFPLFGILAFSLMWTHYMVGALRRRYDLQPQLFRQYYVVTSYVVLVAILLHPTILIVQLWLDGFGLPPTSYLQNYIPPAGATAVGLGSLSLLLFLSYELKRWWKKKSWWKYIEQAQLLAMAGIFVHGLRLGGVLRIEWFRTLWYMYGISLVAVSVYSYRYDKKRKIEERMR
jgi:hypothetical protein